MEVAFLLNGETVRITDQPPTRTLLDWLREDRGLTGTKEGCNEGDCGACTVMVTDADGVRALNACILFLPQLQGRAVRTVEGLSGPQGQPHPVQDAMVTHHGSQCGFCTPGFVVSLAASHLEGATDHDDRLAGNLCRCTGYAPIIRAARSAEAAPVPVWLDDASRLEASDLSTGTAETPQSAGALAEWYLDNPDATLIAGATDVGLWVTKQLRDLPKVAFLSACADLKGIHTDGNRLRIGAMSSIAELRHAIASYHPSLAEMLRRFGSEQVRRAATVGGNIANGSPIGDSPPALVALGASLHLRRGNDRREMPLENFFLDYRKQDRRPGEFVEAVSLPLPTAEAPDRLRCYKLSKRFDQDISAVCGCFVIRVRDGAVSEARIAFGGMAGTPRRAPAAEAALTGHDWSEATVRQAMAALDADYDPMSDMRASAGYRRTTARNMLWRYWLEDQGVATNVLEVTA